MVHLETLEKTLSETVDPVVFVGQKKEKDGKVYKSFWGGREVLNFEQFFMLTAIDLGPRKTSENYSGTNHLRFQFTEERGQ